MARATTPTFIVELPLSVIRVDAHEMGVRLELGRQLYNACLGTGVFDAQDESSEAQQGARNRLRRRPRRSGIHLRCDFSVRHRCKNEAKWNDIHARTDARVGAHECQVIAQQTFSALDLYVFGQSGRPRFKGKGRPLHSLRGKSADSGIYWSPNVGCLEWGSLRLRAKRPPPRRDAWFERALAPHG